MRAGIKTKLIRRKHVKAFALMIAEKQFHRFSRVGGDFYIKGEADLKEFIRSYVARLPSRGKTIN